MASLWLRGSPSRRAATPMTGGQPLHAPDSVKQRRCHSCHGCEPRACWVLHHFRFDVQQHRRPGRRVVARPGCRARYRGDASPSERRPRAGHDGRHLETIGLRARKGNTVDRSEYKRAVGSVTRVHNTVQDRRIITEQVHIRRDSGRQGAFSQSDGRGSELSVRDDPRKNPVGLKLRVQLLVTRITSSRRSPSRLSSLFLTSSRVKPRPNSGSPAASQNAFSSMVVPTMTDAIESGPSQVRGAPREGPRPPRWAGISIPHHPTSYFR